MRIQLAARRLACQRIVSRSIVAFNESHKREDANATVEFS